MGITACSNLPVFRESGQCVHSLQDEGSDLADSIITSLSKLGLFYYVIVFIHLSNIFLLISITIAEILRQKITKILQAGS